MDYETLVFEFARSSRAHTSVNDLVEDFARRVEPLGVTAFTAAVVRDARDRAAIGRYWGRRPEEWGRRYKEANHLKSDVISNRAVHFGKSGYWWDFADKDKLTKLQQAVIADAKEFGLHEGHLTPVPIWDGSTVLVAVYGRNIDSSPDAAIAFEMMASCYAAEGTRLLSRTPQEISGSVPTLVTPTELRYLRWKAKGGSDEEIAAVCGVSRSTVEKAFREVRQRMKVTKTHQAITELIQLGVLKPSETG